MKGNNNIDFFYIIIIFNNNNDINLFHLIIKNEYSY